MKYINDFPITAFLGIPFIIVSSSVVAQPQRLHSSNTFALEEVVVTSQKRSENVQDVPVTISAFTEDFMSTRNMETANDLIAFVPNLQASYPYGETQPIFSIRGQTMADHNTNQSSPISFYVDESNIGPSFLHGMVLFDLERSEVLRGPQGTLYGKNTTGGAINLITRSPSLEGGDAVGDIAFSLGDYGRKHAHGAIEKTIIDDVFGVRSAFTYTKTDGFHRNLFPGADDLTSIDTWSGRFTFSYSGDRLGAILRYTTGESDGQAAAIINEPTIPDGQGGFIDRSGTNARAGTANRWESSQNKAGSYNTTFDNIVLTVNWELENYSVTSITSYLDADALNQQNNDGSDFDLLEDDWNTDTEQFSQDIRLVSELDGAFNFIVGIYYSTDTSDRLNYFDIFHGIGDFNPNLSSGFSTIQIIDQTRDSAAVYAHTTYALSDRLTLTTGLRYTNDKGEYDVLSQIADYDRVPAYDVITRDSYSSKDSEFDDGEFSGKVGLDYQLNDDSMIYINISRGYRSSAFNGGALFDVAEVGAAEPEFVDALETGFKTQFLDGTVQLNGAAFYYDYTDQQLINLVGFQQQLINADKANIKGLEFELMAAVSENLTVNSSLGYLSSEYEELILSNTETGVGNIDLSGNDLIASPELNFSLAVNYTVAETDLGIFTVNFDTVFVDDQWFSAYNDALDYGEIKSDAHWISNAMVTWESVDEKLGVDVWMKNIGNDDSYIYGINARGGFGYDYHVVGLPRRFGVDLTYRF